MDWDKLSDESTIERTAAALRKNGIEVFISSGREEAKKLVLEIIPEGSEVIEGSSTTMNEIGATAEIEESGRYVSLRKKFQQISDQKERSDSRRKASAADYGTGSVHAITEDGQLFAASATGSQLAFYAYGARRLVLVAGAQKIVKDRESALSRIYDYVLPLESERMEKTLGMPSSVSKILIIAKEIPGRITLVLVKEKLGF